MKTVPRLGRAQAYGVIFKILKKLLFFSSLAEMKITVCKHLYVRPLTVKIGLIFFLALCSAGKQLPEATFHPLDQTLPTGNRNSIATLGGVSKCELLVRPSQGYNCYLGRISLNYNASST